MSGPENPYQSPSPLASMQPPPPSGIMGDRELGVGEIITTVFRTVRVSWKDLLVPSLVIAALMALFYLLIFQSTFQWINALTAAGKTKVTTPESRQLMMQGIYGMIGLGLGFGLLIAIMFSFYSLYITLSAARVIQGQSLTPGEIAKAALRKVLPYIAWVFLAALCRFLGTLACILPGIYLGVVLSFITPVVALGVTSTPFKECFRNMTADRWFKALFVYIIFSLMVGIAGYAFTIPASIASGNFMQKAQSQADSAKVMAQMFEPWRLALFLIPAVVQMVATQILLNVAALVMYLNFLKTPNQTQQPAQSSI